MRAYSLEQKAAIRIILLLAERGEVKYTDFTKELHVSEHPIKKARKILLDGKLIEQRIESGPLRFMYTLTDKGRRAAEKLQELEAILREESK